MARPRAYVLIAASAALAVGASACGGSASGGVTSATAHSASTSSNASGTASSSSSRAAAPRRRRPRPRGAAIGATLRTHAGSSTLDVTVSRVLDPLVGTGASLPPGMRAAGAEVAIHNAAGATYDSTASGDWSILTTGGLASPLFVRHGICQTPLADFESLIGVGETRTGCVAFSVPRRARILSVRFSPHSRAPGTVAWR